MRPYWNVGSVLRAGTIGVVAAAVCLGAGTRGALAQGGAGGGEGERPARQAPRTSLPVGVPEVLLSVEFPGGTVEEYVRAVQAAVEAASGGAANVLLPAEAAEVEIPAIRLRGVSVFTALQALEWSVSRNAEHRFSVVPFGQAYPSAPPQAFAVQYQRTGSGASPFPTRAGRPAAGPGRSVEVFSIRELADVGGDEVIISVDRSTETRRLSSEAILTSIESALALVDGGVSAPELKYHKDSGLLIVLGTPEQLAVVQGVLRELRSNMESRVAAERARAFAVAEREYRRKRLEVEMSLQQQELQRAHERLERVREGFATADGQRVPSPPDAIAQAEQAVAGAMARLRMMELEGERPIRVQEEAGERDAAAREDTAALLRTIDELRRMVAELRAERAKDGGKQER